MSHHDNDCASVDKKYYQPSKVSNREADRQATVVFLFGKNITDLVK